MSKGTRGRESSVGSLEAVCKARCELAVEDTSKFVELYNFLQKILVCLGILFLVNSRRNMDDVVVRVLELQRQHDAVPGSFSVLCVRGKYLPILITVFHLNSCK